MSVLEELDIHEWDASISQSHQQRAIQSLEEGKILFFPHLCFLLHEDERRFLSHEYVDPKRKNISYNPVQDTLGGSLCTGSNALNLKGMLKRYVHNSCHFINKLLPHYSSHLVLAKTSFRPTEIFGRKSSIRKDDTRLHIDAFPSNPTKGRRILRMFTNINPKGRARIWKVGEPFEEVVKKFACKVPKPLPYSAQILKFLKITKETRTSYDHYMLHMHNCMKEDDHYQTSVAQEEIHFPAQSSWMVFTDQVSHAALSGQHVLEQTFSLPSHGVKNFQTAPLKILENFLNRTLI